MIADPDTVENIRIMLAAGRTDVPRPEELLLDDAEELIEGLTQLSHINFPE